MKKLILMWCFVALSGCESLEVMKDHRRTVAAEAQDQISRTSAVDTSRTAHFTDGAFIANPKDAIRYVEPLPPVFNQKITINESTALSLPEISERITHATSVPVRLLSEATAQSTDTPTSTGGGLPPPPPGIPSLSLPTSGSAAVNTMTNTPSMRLSYTNGSLAGLLDVIASKNNVNWRYENGGIEIYRYLTKTFKVHTLPGTRELSASVERGGNGGNGGATGSNQMGGMGGTSTTTTTGSTNGNSITQTTAVNAEELSAWKDLENSIKTMLSPKGTIVISQTTGSATVTDTPDRVNQVEKYIDEVNKIMTQQVAIHYRILAVANNDNTRMGINWTAVFNSLNRNYGVSLASMALPQAAAGSALISALIPDTATGTMGQLAGSQILIDALETQGRVSNVTSGSVTTLNNKPAPVQAVTEQSYIATVQALQTANVGSSTGVQQSKVVTGFSMNLLPHILDDDRVLMQYNINLSALISLVERTVGTTTVQSPEIDTRSFMNEVSMRAGETLVLSGFENTGTSLRKTGSIFQGGGEDATEKKAIVVILITPVLIVG